MNITVYLGANEGNDPRLAQAVRELGRWIGESGNALIYGGSACGLMGELAKTGAGIIMPACFRTSSSSLTISRSPAKKPAR